MKHGEERNHRMERRDGKTVELIDRETGAIVYRGPMEETVKEKWCAFCGKWVEVRGVLGAIHFIAEHDEHEERPASISNPVSISLVCPHCRYKIVFDVPADRTASVHVRCTSCGGDAGYVLPPKANGNRPKKRSRR